MSSFTVKNGSSIVGLHQRRNAGSDFDSCLRKMLNLWKLFVECRSSTVIIVYRAAKLYEGIDHFKKGRTSMWDEERLGRPSTSRTEN
jgi:hypothetical protein